MECKARHSRGLFNALRVISEKVIADRISILVDTVFDNYRMYGSTELCLAAAGFALQIYCDFNSYSTIAVGTAKIMGVTLIENFCAPYFAVSVKVYKILALDH